MHNEMVVDKALRSTFLMIKKKLMEPMKLRNLSKIL